MLHGTQADAAPNTYLEGFANNVVVICRVGPAGCTAVNARAREMLLERPSHADGDGPMRW